MMEKFIEQWSEEKQEHLANRLTGFWAEDEWNIVDCPFFQGDTFKIFRNCVQFNCISPQIKAELKYACWQKLERKEWSVKTFWTQSSNLYRIIEWLNTYYSHLSSLVEKSLETLELSYRSYLVKEGKWREGQSSRRIIRSQTVKEYPRRTVQTSALRQIYKILEEAYDERDEYEKDIWDLRKLNILENPSKSEYKLNFTKITQSWLKQAAKKYIKYTLSIYAPGECRSRLVVIQLFSVFLKQNYPNINPEEIDRQTILDYLSYLSQCSLGVNTRINRIIETRNFLEVCPSHGFASIVDKRLIYAEDIPRATKAQPRFIPEEIINQLNQNLNSLPSDIRRMVLVIQECGMRIGELCRMPMNCLIRDVHGDWFLRYYQYKMKKEHSVPISKEIAAVIDEQQKVTIEQCGQDFPYLFPNPQNWRKGKPMSQEIFSSALNTLAYEKNICDATGKLWRFQAHQFRHSLRCKMVNLNVPITVIMRYLGHESPEMTIRYAHIHDQTLKAEFLKFQSKLVDVTGKFIKLQQVEAEIAQGIDPNTINEQWLKRNILAQALPNGLCALPVVQGHCPYGANKCLTGADGKGCPHFKTDIRYLDKHKEHLKRTQEIIEWAQENSQSRRSQEILKENLPVGENLQRIIVSLEEKNDEPR